MGYIVEYVGGEKVSGYVYKTVDGAEKKAVSVYEQTGKPTIVVDEKYRKYGNTRQSVL